MDKIIATFDSVFSELDPKKDKIAILMHKDPDPDAVGSALGVKWILKKKYSLPARIYYAGDVDHRQMETLMNVLNISIHPINMLELTSASKIVIVDATPANSQVGSADLVIDHHKSEETGNDIIEPVGSCSTIVYEIMKAFGLSLSDKKDDEIDLATCMFFGIRIDTNELLSDGTTSRDWEAYQELSKIIDRKKTSQIINYTYPSYFWEIEKISMCEDNYREHSGWFVCGVGYISKSRKNTLSMLSEKMIKYEGIETSIIFGIKDGNLEVSIRSTNNSIDVNKLAKSLFGDQYSGGRRGAGGARVPLGILFPDNMPDELMDSAWETVKSLVFYRVNQKSKGN